MGYFLYVCSFKNFNNHNNQAKTASIKTELVIIKFRGNISQPYLNPIYFLPKYYSECTISKQLEQLPFWPRKKMSLLILLITASRQTNVNNMNFKSYLHWLAKKTKTILIKENA